MPGPDRQLAYFDTLMILQLTERLARPRASGLVSRGSGSVGAAFTARRRLERMMDRVGSFILASLYWRVEGLVWLLGMVSRDLRGASTGGLGKDLGWWI